MRTVQILTQPLCKMPLTYTRWWPRRRACSRFDFRSRVAPTCVAPHALAAFQSQHSAAHATAAGLVTGPTLSSHRHSTALHLQHSCASHAASACSAPASLALAWGSKAGSAALHSTRCVLPTTPAACRKAHCQPRAHGTFQPPILPPHAAAPSHSSSVTLRLNSGSIAPFILASVRHPLTCSSETAPPRGVPAARSLAAAARAARRHRHRRHRRSRAHGHPWPNRPPAQAASGTVRRRRCTRWAGVRAACRTCGCHAWRSATPGACPAGGSATSTTSERVPSCAGHAGNGLQLTNS